MPETTTYGSVDGACAAESHGEAVANLAEAMYRASVSDPYSDLAHREFARVKGDWQYRAIRVLQWLKEES